jgi:hypothetical protein
MAAKQAMWASIVVPRRDSGHWDTAGKRGRASAVHALPESFVEWRLSKWRASDHNPATFIEADLSCWYALACEITVLYLGNTWPGSVI